MSTSATANHETGATLSAGPRPEIAQYRRELLDRIFRPFAIFGLVALTVGSWRAIDDGEWEFAAAYLGIYGAGVLVAVFFRGLSVSSRTAVLLLGLIGIAVAGLLRLGPSGVGVLILVAWCGLTGILRGTRAALGAVAVSILIILGLGLATSSGYVPVGAARTTALTLGDEITIALTFAAVTVGLILPTHALSGKLTQSVTELEASNARLRDEVRRRERAERAARASERRYRGIFESASVGILEEDLTEVRAALAELRDQGVEDVRTYLEQHPEFVARAAALLRVADVNPATIEMYGAESKDQLLASLDRIFVPESLDAFRDVLVAFAEGRRRYRGETVNGTLQGERIDVLLEAAIPQEPEESVLVSVLDITERRRLERSFAQAQKMEAVGTLAGGIAHDFNNILMGIGGYAALLKRRLTEPGPHRGHLESIEQMVDSGASLTAQLLGFARGGPDHVQTTDLREQLHRSLALFGRAKPEIRIEERLAGDLFTVDVDRNQLEQALLNLYVNAWQAMPDGGLLTVRAANVHLNEEEAEVSGFRSGDYVRVSVEDTGVGMDAATRARVFEPFFTTKEPGSGTGLGLASAYGIVKNHGGVIDVQSEPGAGAAFVVLLPAAKKPARASQEPTSDEVGGHETVLLVDDQPSVRQSTALLLEDLGYRVLTARSGAQAIEQLAAHREEVALAMVDMVMPAMGGAELFARLRQIQANLPILLTSGYDRDARAEELLRLGRCGFIHKPYTLDGLSSKVRAVLDAC